MSSWHRSIGIQRQYFITTWFNEIDRGTIFKNIRSIFTIVLLQITYHWQWSKRYERYNRSNDTNEFMQVIRTPRFFYSSFFFLIKKFLSKEFDSSSFLFFFLFLYSKPGQSKQLFWLLWRIYKKKKRTFFSDTLSWISFLVKKSDKKRMTRKT